MFVSEQQNLRRGSAFRLSWKCIESEWKVDRVSSKVISLYFCIRCTYDHQRCIESYQKCLKCFREWLSTDAFFGCDRGHRKCRISSKIGLLYIESRIETESIDCDWVHVAACCREYWMWFVGIFPRGTFDPLSITFDATNFIEGITERKLVELKLPRLPFWAVASLVTTYDEMTVYQ